MSRRGDPTRRPYMTTTLTGTLLMGVLLLADAARADASWWLSMGDLGDAWVGAIGAILAAGGAVALLGCRTYRMPSTAWRIEAVGQLLCAGGWSLYTGAVLILHPESPVHWLLPAVLAAASARRLGQVTGQDRRALAAKRKTT